MLIRSLLILGLIYVKIVILIAKNVKILLVVLNVFMIIEILLIIVSVKMGNMHRHSMGVVLKIVILGVKGVMRLVVFARNVRMMLREIRQMNVIVFL